MHARSRAFSWRRRRAAWRTSMRPRPATRRSWRRRRRLKRRRGLSTAEQMVGSVDQYKGSAQTEIRFRPGQTVLSKAAKDALDEMAAPLKDQRSYIIEVRGFAPGRGQTAIASSQKIADSVVRYLVLNHQIPVYRIYVMSMGSSPVAGADGTMAKQTSGGRVEVSLMKNDLAGSVQH